MFKGIKGLAGSLAGVLHIQADKLEAWAGVEEADSDSLGINTDDLGVVLDVEEYRRATLGITDDAEVGLETTGLGVPQGTGEEDLGTADDEEDTQGTAEVSGELTYDEDYEPTSTDSTRFNDPWGATIPGVYVYNGD